MKSKAFFSIESEIDGIDVVSRFNEIDKRLLADAFEYANWLAGENIRALMRNVIIDGNHQKNSEMTRWMKGTSTPLVEDAMLIKSINHRARRFKSHSKIRVGVFKHSKNVNVAKMVARGYTITVTKKMAKLFSVMHMAQVKEKKFSPNTKYAHRLYRRTKGRVPLLSEGSKIVVPARPFDKTTRNSSNLRPWLKRPYYEMYKNLATYLKTGHYAHKKVRYRK